ncbi:MAG: CDP-alcohol phosphatidyltransferase family protein [Kineosporiaceae bacterium]
MAEHGWYDGRPQSPRTLANAVTVVRTVAAVAVAVHGIAVGSLAWLAAGYLVYWAGDIADGALARAMDQETRLGGVGDVVCDRICTVTLGVGLWQVLPEMRLPIAIFLAQFAVVDLVLSLVFVRHPVLSPNYFYLVDRPIFRWNWSKPAKALNTSVVVLCVAVVQWWWPAVIAACAAAVIKSVSLVRWWTVVRPGRPGAPEPGAG